MKLSTKTILLLTAITMVSFSAAIYIQYTSVRPMLITMEANADRKDVERVVLGFDMVRDRINLLTYDHALWNDTYNFLYNWDQDYLDNNFQPDTFIDNEFDILILTSRMGSIVWAQVANPETDDFYPQGYFDFTELLPYMANARDARPEAPVSFSGLASTSLGPVIYSSYSVLRSNESGKSPGSLLIGRIVDTSTTENIQELTQISFSTTELDYLEARAFSKKKLNEQYRNKNNQIDWYIADVADLPALKISLQLNPRAFNDGLVTPPVLTATVVILFSWLLIIYFMNKTLVQPILNIGNHLFKIRKTSDYSLRLNSSAKDELGTLSNECDRLIEYISIQKALVEKQATRLQHLSTEDSLTHLANRRRLDQLLTDNWNLCLREKRPLSIIMCDIDYFKPFNDNYGHQAGDKALVTVARLLKDCLQRGSDFAARYGGEEFILVLPDTDERGALIVAQRLQRLIKQAAIAHEYSKIASVITFSLGITTTAGNQNTTPERLINQADKALYQAKQEGRNRICCYQQLIPPEASLA